MTNKNQTTQVDEDDMWAAATIEMTMEWGTQAQKDENWDRWDWALEIAIKCEDDQDMGVKYAEICDCVIDDQFSQVVAKYNRTHRAK